MHITSWKKDRRYGKRVFKLRKRQSLPKFTWSSIIWGGLGVLPQKIFRFFISQEHILSNFKHFLKHNSIRITVFFRFFRNNLISFLFPPGHQNILAISLSILFPCNFPCKCLNFLLQGNFLASGSPGCGSCRWRVVLWGLETTNTNCELIQSMLAKTNMALSLSDNPKYLFLLLFLFKLFGIVFLKLGDFCGVLWELIFGRTASEGDVQRFVLESKNMEYIYGKAIPTFESFNQYCMEKELPMSAILARSRSSCRNCGRELFVDGSWKAIVVYHMF